MEPKYYLVERTLLPEVLRKVVCAKQALETGQCRTTTEAVRQFGLSRSAFYKYKDGIRPFVDMTVDRIITFHCMLEDKAGVLSSILGAFAAVHASVLTIHQSIPTGGRASVTIAARTGDMQCTTEALLQTVEALDGVLCMELIASE